MTATCRDCGAEGEWRELPSGKWLLYTMQPHVKECPKRRTSSKATDTNGAHSKARPDTKTSMGLFGAHGEATEAERAALLEALERAQRVRT